jgi:hypothetical protein
VVLTGQDRSRGKVHVVRGPLHRSRCLSGSLPSRVDVGVKSRLVYIPSNGVDGYLFVDHPSALE